jgi:hypothetical protein
MPDLIRHPVSFWIPASAGITTVEYLPAGLILKKPGPLGQARDIWLCRNETEKESRSQNTESLQ